MPKFREVTKTLFASTKRLEKLLNPWPKPINKQQKTGRAHNRMKTGFSGSTG